MVHLTIEGEKFSINADDHFYYNGKLSSCPEWFLSLLEDTASIRLPTGAVHFRDLANGHPSIYPNSIVFRKRVTLNGVKSNTINSLMVMPNEETTESVSSDT